MRGAAPSSKVPPQHNRKPNSVPMRPRSLATAPVTTIPLAPPSLAGSSGLPGGFGRAVLEHLPIWPCSVRGLACHPPYGARGALLPHLFTLTSRRAGLAPSSLEAVYFLCHFPSGRPDRGLPGALPSGVRTFLPVCARLRIHAAVVWLTAAECQRTCGLTTRPSLDGYCTARASCRGCYAGYRSPRPSSRCSTQTRVACARETRVRSSP